MNFQTYFGITFLFIAVILSLVLIVYFYYKGNKTSELYSFICFQFLICIWSSGQIFEIFCHSTQSKWNSIVFQYFGISFIGLVWMIFSFSYTNNKAVVNKKYIIPLIIPPIIFYLSILTNDYHKLFYSEFNYKYSVYGLLFWLHLIVSYTYLMIGTILMIRYSREQLSYKRKQSILITFAVLIPIVSNIIYILKIFQFHIDITPVSFSISMLLFSIVTFRYRFFDIIPIATKKAVDNLKEAIVIIDSFNKIVDFNSSFANTFFNKKVIKKNDSIKEFIVALKEKLSESDSYMDILNTIEYGTEQFESGEIILSLKENRYFKVNVQPIYSNKGKNVLGRVISFNDISAYKMLVREIDEKNSELQIKNEQLKEYLLTVEELAMAKERNRITQDVHDNLGHSISLIIALLEICKITYKTEPKKTEEKLYEAVNVAREGLKALRCSLVGLAPNSLASENLVSALKNLASGFELAGIKIDLIVEGVNKQLNCVYTDAIYRICKEALTNSLRHGKARQVSIILKIMEDRIKLFIFDDGCGCSNINKGLGLTGIENRVKNLNGSINYSSDGEKGFNIHIQIQLKGKIEDDKNDNNR